jgi:serine/threonine protein kinase
MVARFAPLAPEDPREVSGYALRARLGGGGMGRVYLSFTPGGRALAIKVIRPEHAEDEEFRRRFQREVIAAQRVQGLFTAPVVDADPTAALPWLATAYVPGPSLRQVVAEHGPLPPLTVFRLVAGVAEGLAAVHACEIIHRDLKPANVLLAEDGPRVIDFGIAHAAEATSLTSTGLTVGTPAFMAPEQIRGRAATSATDVFGLGHLAVFAATGHTAFGEGNQDALLYRIIHEHPDLDDCPQEVRAIALPCLAKDPDERPELTEVMADARQQTSGQTLQLAGSWLPAAIADSLATYDIAAYRVETNRLTKPVDADARAGNATLGQQPGAMSSSSDRSGGGGADGLNPTAGPDPSASALAAEPPTVAASTPTLVEAARPVAEPAGVAPPSQPPYPQAPYPQRSASSSGIAITAMILCTLSSLSLVWSAISFLTGSPPLVARADMPPGVTLLANGVWTIGDLLLIVGTILMWSRTSAGRILAIIGLSLVLTSMLALELVALSAPDDSFVRPWTYLINVFTVLSLAFVLLPGTGSYLKAGRPLPNGASGAPTGPGW